MRHRSVTRPIAPLALMLVLGACGDDDGTGPGDQIATTIEIANAPITFDLSGQQEQLDVTVLDQDGQPIADPLVTFDSSAEGVAAVSSSGVVTALADGTTTIEVASGSASASIDVTVALTVTELQAGVAQTGLSAPQNGLVLFRMDVPAGNEGTQVLQVRLLGGTGDADLYVRYDVPPEPQLHDCDSAGFPSPDFDNIELCAITDPAPGTWFVTLVAYEGFTDVTLEADVVEWTALAAGVPETDLSADLLDVLYFRIDTEEGQTLDLAMSGGTGDADLHATDEGSFSVYGLADMPCAPLLPGNDEDCSLTDVAQGTWTVMLFAYEAFSGVTLTAGKSASAPSATRRAAAPDDVRRAPAWKSIGDRAWSVVRDARR